MSRVCVGSQPVLFTPGPVRIPESVSRAFIAPPCNYHRQAAFRRLFADTQDDLKSLLGLVAPNEFAAVVLTSTGTGANEAALQALAPLGRGLIVCNGFFAERLRAQAQQNGIAHEAWTSPDDLPVDVDRFEAELDCHGNDIRWVYFVSHETRAGLRNPLEEIGRACRRRGLFVAADVVSSAFAYRIDIEAAGLDLAIMSSAKGLMSVPGLGIAVVRNQAMERLAAFKRRAYYLDLVAEWAKQRSEMQPRFAQPVALHAALAAACTHLGAVGIDNHFLRISRQMADLVEHLRHLGIGTRLVPAHRSNVAVNFALPAGITYAAFSSQLEQQGYYALYGLPGDETTFQLSTIGHLDDEHVEGMKRALSLVFARGRNAVAASVSASASAIALGESQAS
ncbi:MAG: alanine--glyoxylate aminotransferase family protein [Deltaproteobacteria bacterium]|nr:alanine--glyoxylate aminotransferase family protein [Deltaproteobacteria bacterium]